MAKKVLADHKQTGKIFKPPLLTMATFVEAGWLDFAVPEFIWILLLMEEYGTEKGTILIIEFASICDEFISPKCSNGSASCIISSYNLLTEKEKKQILSASKKSHILKEFQLALRPFLKLYPECPLKFLQPTIIPKNISISRKHLTKYKSGLDKIMDKTGVESTFVMAAVTAFLINFNRISVVKSNNIPHLKNVVDYPNTEESKHLASFLRTAIPMCFNIEGAYNRENTWVKYFWNHSFKLEPYKL